MRRVVALLVLCLLAGAASAQVRRTSPPAWAELTAEQQQVLGPLKADWDALTPDRRRKWIGIAKRYPKLKAGEQARIRQRMQRWAKLSPEQRRQVRNTYKQLAKKPPEKRGRLRDQWAEYQSLTPGERQPNLAPARPTKKKK